jgi:membrane protein
VSPTPEKVRDAPRTADIARTPLGVLKATMTEWRDDRAPRLAAALAYHTIFAMAPLLVIAVSLAGFVLGPRSTRDRLVQQVLEFTGSIQIADFVEGVIQQTSRREASALGTIVGVVVLLIGASNVFNELKAALNDIWGASSANARGLIGVVINRALSVGMVLLTGVILLATIVLTTALTRATQSLDSSWPGTPVVTQIGAFILTYLLTVLVLAMIYRYVPDVRISWRDVWSGAAVTGLLLSIGRLLISLYLGFSTVGSAYGAAGALAVMLLWIYYSAQIFFFGAEFTQVFARTRGSRWHEQEKLDAPVEEPS